MALKQELRQIIDSPEAAMCEPVYFELLRAAPAAQRHRIVQYFATLHMLPTPQSLWRDARLLGQKCANRGVAPRSMDLLIAVICIHERAAIVTFDSHFQQIAKIARLEVILLSRFPAAAS